MFLSRYNGSICRFIQADTKDGGSKKATFMGEIILHVFEHAFLDTIKLLPFLFLAILAMECLEHFAGEHILGALKKAGRFSPAAGAALGCIPQCGFSVAAAQLFNNGLVTAGTVVAVFLATSDEAIPILLTRSEGLSAIWPLILSKVIIAIVAGFALDLIWNVKKQQAAALEHTHEDHDHCGVSFGSILWASLKRSLSILLFIFIATLILNFLIEGIGEDRLGQFLLTNHPLQPLVAAIFGFIPNCAISVILTEFYLSGAISFGATVAGLCTSAGVGMLVLLRGKRSWKQYVAILGTCLIAAVLTGSVLQWIGV